MNVTVAISGINAIDNPGPGTGIARSLKESDIDVRTVGFAYDSMEPGIFMEVIDKSYILPWPSCKPSTYLDRLKYINNREQIDIIIPALDAELPLYMNIKKEIEAMGIKLLIPEKEMFTLRDKTKLDILAPKLGLKSPQTISMTSVSDLEIAKNKFGYPMMIKGPFYEAYKAQTYTEAEKYFYDLSSKWGLPILAQEFVEGEEFDLVGLGGGNGEDMGKLAIKKMLVTKLGKVWTNVSIRNNAIFEAADKLIKELKWCGGYELELLKKKESDEFFLLEINPRFPAWLYMATGCGINLPERLIKKLIGMEYDSHSNYDAGKILVRYTEEIIRDISDIEKLTINAEL